MRTSKKIGCIAFIKLYMEAYASGRTASDLCRELGMSKNAFRQRVFYYRRNLRRIGTELPSLRRSVSEHQSAPTIRMASIVEEAVALAARRSYRR